MPFKRTVDLDLGTRLYALAFDGIFALDLERQLAIKSVFGPIAKGAPHYYQIYQYNKGLHLLRSRGFIELRAVSIVEAVEMANADPQLTRQIERWLERIS